MAHWRALVGSLLLAPLLASPSAAEPSLPDLVISDFGFTSTGVLEATLHNRGGWVSNFHFEINLYNVDSNVKLTRFRALEFDPAMKTRDGGTELRVELSKALSPPGAYRLALVIDDGNAVPESDETNNRAEGTFRVGSNLVVASAVGRTQRDASGTKATVTAVVQNRGTTSTEWDGVRCVLKAAAPEGLQEFDIGIVKPAESRSFTIPTVLPSLRKSWTMTAGCYTPHGNFRPAHETSIVPSARK